MKYIRMVSAMLSLIILSSGCQNYPVPADSMEPAMPAGNSILVMKKFVQPVKREDVIVFHPPVRNGESDKEYVKRCIAVAGDGVEIRDGSVFLDGKKLEEPYVKGVTYPGPPVQNTGSCSERYNYGSRR